MFFFAKIICSHVVHDWLRRKPTKQLHEKEKEKTLVVHVLIHYLIYFEWFCQFGEFINSQSTLRTIDHMLKICVKIHNPFLFYMNKL
jgi:hypothetical protein